MTGIPGNDRVMGLGPRSWPFLCTHIVLCSVVQDPTNPIGVQHLQLGLDVVTILACTRGSKIVRNSTGFVWPATTGWQGI